MPTPDASPVSTIFRTGPRRWTALLAGAALVVLAGWGAHRWTWQRGLDRLSQDAVHRLEMAAAAVDAQLARFDYLPSLLETTPAVLDLLAGPVRPAERDEVNRLLSALNATAGAEMLYVLDGNGLTIAAADWDREGTPYGMNLAFRPYVREALAQGRGRFYGVGITSGRAGYYLSYALKRDGRTLGLATAKVSLAANEKAWAQLPGQLMLLDERGVVILASEPRWRYRPQAALSDAQKAEIARSRPYGNSTLQPLDWRAQAADDDHVLARFEGRRYLVSERTLHDGRWRLRALDDLAALTAQAWQAALTGGLAVLVATLLGSLWAMRRRTLRQRLRAAEALRAAHAELESKVVQRTAELRRTNERLEAEVQARRRTEDELRAAQQELVHNGKMAALGQMSAGMMHELNQPLAAMRTLSDNACVLLDQGREPEVRRNLQRLTHLVDRLGKLTAQLKLFAWKPGRSPLGAVKVAQAVAQAQFVLAERQRERGVEIAVEIEPPTLTVRADEGRLEQVLINLVGNGLEAMAHAAAPARLLVRTTVQGEVAHIVVQDQGPGIPADILPRLFEPFTTSKPAGSGLGLGLMISAHFAREFGGSLHGENVPGGGARFVLLLPLAGQGPAAEAEVESPASSLS
jgi:two-component system C4-dicarboxylate transport sensor histidine kinase DctB